MSTIPGGSRKAAFLARQEAVLKKARALDAAGETMNLTLLARLCGIGHKKAKELIVEAGLEHVLYGSPQ